ncbi:MAG: rubrerythrin family protein [Deltaproteobacteria bacterium]|nr:rubrerythrin family protein [Deltaproteobacteria bacterium]MBF0526310.1 rubrerythrin family protein [Deltaproteobacteria bacterium]
MSKTEKNLKEAFAGESQANRKYLAFADQADKEGFKAVAKLFRAAAAAETIHAHKHLKVMQGINATSDNLKEAIAGETHEFKSMYPKMIAEAQEEGNRAAEMSFTYANEVEKVHAALYQEALDNLKDYPEHDFYVCRICGHTVADEAPDQCPVCGSKKNGFCKVE